jgi:hypothetical protein
MTNNQLKSPNTYKSHQLQPRIDFCKGKSSGCHHEDDTVGLTTIKIESGKKKKPKWKI